MWILSNGNEVTEEHIKVVQQESFSWVKINPNLIIDILSKIVLRLPIKEKIFLVEIESIRQKNKVVKIELLFSIYYANKIISSKTIFVTLPTFLKITMMGKKFVYCTRKDT